MSMSVSSVRAWLLISVVFLVLNGIAASSALGLERADKQDSFLDHQSLFEPAWASLLDALPSGTRFHAISIEDRRISVEISTDAVRLHRLSVYRERFLGLFDRTVVEALQPVPSADSGFQAALFS